MSFTPLKLVIASCSGDTLTLYLVEYPDKHKAIFKFEKLKRKVKIAIKFIGVDRPTTVDCSLKGDEVEDKCLSEVGDLVDKVFPGVKEDLVSELRKVLREWDNIRLAEELKAEEKRLTEGLTPVIEEEVEGKIVTFNSILDFLEGFFNPFLIICM